MLPRSYNVVISIISIRITINIYGRFYRYTLLHNSSYHTLSRSIAFNPIVRFLPCQSDCLNCFSILPTVLTTVTFLGSNTCCHVDDDDDLLVKWKFWLTPLLGRKQLWSAQTWKIWKWVSDAISFLGKEACDGSWHNTTTKRLEKDFCGFRWLRGRHAVLDRNSQGKNNKNNQVLYAFHVITCWQPVILLVVMPSFFRFYVLGLLVNLPNKFKKSPNSRKRKRSRPFNLYFLKYVLPVARTSLEPRPNSRVFHRVSQLTQFIICYVLLFTCIFGNISKNRIRRRNKRT